MTITGRTRFALADVQRLLGTSFFFDVRRDDTIVDEDDGKPALLDIQENDSRGKDDPLAFTIRVNEARHFEKYGSTVSDAQLHSNALHEILHAFRHKADKLGEYRLRAKERIEHDAAQEAAVYAEERALAPLVLFWFRPWPVRLWLALVRKFPTLDTL